MPGIVAEVGGLVRVAREVGAPHLPEDRRHLGAPAVREDVEAHLRVGAQQVAHPERMGATHQRDGGVLPRRHGMRAAARAVLAEEDQRHLTPLPLHHRARAESARCRAVRRGRAQMVPRAQAMGGRHADVAASRAAGAPLHAAMDGGGPALRLLLSEREHAVVCIHAPVGRDVELQPAQLGERHMARVGRGPLQPLRNLIGRVRGRIMRLRARRSAASSYLARRNGGLLCLPAECALSVHLDRVMLLGGLAQHCLEPRTLIEPGAIVIDRRVAHESAALALCTELHTQATARKCTTS